MRHYTAIVVGVVMKEPRGSARGSEIVGRAVQQMRQDGLCIATFVWRRWQLWHHERRRRASRWSRCSRYCLRC